MLCKKKISYYELYLRNKSSKTKKKSEKGFSRTHKNFLKYLCSQNFCIYTRNYVLKYYSKIIE